MDSIFRICKVVAQEKEGLIRKTTQKERHKNQYTVQIVMPQNTESFKQQTYSFSTRIPPSLEPNFIVEHNLLFPRYIKTYERLGMLSVHPVSHNYRVTRMDLHRSLICLTLEQQLLPIMQVEDYYQMIKNPQLKKVWDNFFLFQQIFDTKMPEVTRDVLETLSQIKAPFECHINKCTDKGTITTQRVLNQEFLTLQGISYGMLEQYIHETGLIPSSIMSDQEDEDYQEFVKMCEGWRTSDYKVELINYSGQRFSARQSINVLKSDRIIRNFKHQIAFFMYDQYPKWVNEELVKINEADFAQQLKIRKDQEKQIEEEMANRNNRPRCGIKFI